MKNQRPLSIPGAGGGGELGRGARGREGSWARAWGSPPGAGPGMGGRGGGPGVHASSGLPSGGAERPRAAEGRAPRCPADPRARAPAGPSRAGGRVPSLAGSSRRRATSLGVLEALPRIPGTRAACSPLLGNWVRSVVQRSSTCVLGAGSPPKGAESTCKRGQCGPPGPDLLASDGVGKAPLPYPNHKSTGSRGWGGSGGGSFRVGALCSPLGSS